MESARDVTTGITDGTCIQFTPTKPLRRGPVEDARLPEGYFFPPFGTRWSYRTSTYAGHSDFAVDFNRGGPGADEGDWVTAPAPGSVAYLDFRAPGTDGPDDPGVSDLLIDHAGGFRTLYSHMKDIPRTVRVGAPIELRQRLGRISDIGTTTGSHLHHGHYRKVPGRASGFGTPIKMRIQDVPMDASVGDSETGHEDGWVVEGQRVRGPVLRAVFRVRVWRGRRTGRGGASSASPSPPKGQAGAGLRRSRLSARLGPGTCDGPTGDEVADISSARAPDDGRYFDPGSSTTIAVSRDRRAAFASV